MKTGSFFVFLLWVFLCPAVFGQSGQLVYPYATPKEISRNKIKEVLLLSSADQKVQAHYFFDTRGRVNKLIEEDHFSKQSGPLVQEISWNPDSTIKWYSSARLKLDGQKIIHASIEDHYSKSGKLWLEKRENKFDNPTLDINVIDTLHPKKLQQTTYYFSPDYSDTLKKIINYEDDQQGLYAYEEKVNGQWLERQKMIHRRENGVVIYVEEYENGKLKRSYQPEKNKFEQERIEEESYNPLPFNDSPRRDSLLTKDISPYARFVQADLKKQYKIVIYYQLMNRNKVDFYQISNAKNGMLLEINYPEFPESGRKFEYVYYEKKQANRK